MSSAARIPPLPAEGGLGMRVRTLRAAARLTIREVAERSGIAISSISKIENNQLSPTYENILRLARGLGVDIAELFSDTRKESPRGRRSLTRAGDGKVYRTPSYAYEMLCTDLVGKKMIPMKARILAGSGTDLSPLMTHEGEEVLLILSGVVELRTEFYEPVILRAGDCAYFDSTMGHVCLLHGVEDAEVFWVCSSSDVIGLVAGGQG
ncbi:helix-turn-helix transcriptional regulator [Roseomonas sp. SSH11]|uniref:Helix-turn-helix transcriptional regulator n=1 Tax=Pararoseomonas baculiformis TaxID=2820812 RepID=A0ABS4AJG2_9PROT|nr:XRE family transcriptional regulator [Pararoseomonas baculiformis]MBP0447153.1 helix-turn-helix transcriptional regulator [Pararoseomonas baculiformis]